MAAALSLLVVVGITMLVTKVATVALEHTGMAREAARFQARSALTGVGFPTTEAGEVVRHPVRRRIVMALMLFGNVGVVSVVSTLVLSFAGEHTVSLVGRAGSIVIGLGALAALAWSPPVDRALSRLIGLALRRWTRLERRDYASLLHLAGDYSVKELEVEEGDWVVDRPLGVLRLSDEGVVVLGIERSTGAWVGAPRRDTIVRAGDVLVLYGRERTMAQLDRRRDGSFGDLEHRAAVEELRLVRQREEELEQSLEEALFRPPGERRPRGAADAATAPPR